MHELWREFRSNVTKIHRAERVCNGIHQQERIGPWHGPEARAALAALAAFLTMGLFEYNFGDSEVVVILLFIVTLPFAASSGIARARKDASDNETA